MTTQIKSLANEQGLIKANISLLSLLDGHEDVVNATFIIPGENGVISCSEDKSIRIWLKRDRASYWPSVCHTLPAPASSMDYHHQSKRLFVAMDNGYISEFSVATDYNRILQIKNYAAHQGRVKAIVFSPDTGLLLSIGKDKYFVWHSTIENGSRIGSYICSAAPSALQFDSSSKHVFIGNFNGQIEMLKLENQQYKFITTFSGHLSAVRSLYWSSTEELLFSGSGDKTIICWDIGGKKGTAYELNGHRNSVTSLFYSNSSKQIFSTSEDCNIVIWNMNQPREETPSWKESDYCQICQKPFFWNFRAMYDQKTIGSRQHHCRLCGRAICDTCSPARSTLPRMGFEFPVRLCTECTVKVKDADRVSLAKFYDTRHCVAHMHVDEPNKMMVTSGYDRVIKLWDISDVLP